MSRRMGTLGVERVQAQLVPGSYWRDNDPRTERIVKVVKVGIATVFIKAVRMDGNPGHARVTETKINRFGRSGRNGFTLVKQPCACEGQCGLKANPGSHIGSSFFCRVDEVEAEAADKAAEYPDYPCPKDSEGVHSIGCGCDF